MSATRQPITIDRNTFYQNYSKRLIVVLIIAILILLAMATLVMYQIFHRPQPQFSAVTQDGQRMILKVYNEPNLTSTTILNWAAKAAVAAYTFDFVNYDQQMDIAKSYFTESGWKDYQDSVAKLIAVIKQNQLFVNGVVSGPPVISNEGPLPDKGYVWRVQLPFLVTYQSAEKVTKQSFMVTINIIHVPTNVNPKGIGVDQFAMR